MSGEQIPLYVRLSEEPSRRLERAVALSGKSKRQIVEEAVIGLLSDEGLVVDRAELREDAAEPAGAAPPDALPEVLTVQEAAGLLRIDAKDLKAAASAGQIPARRIGGKWRFSRAAILAWLAHTEE